MQQLNLPEYSFKIIVEGDKKFIFDRWRKKYVLLTSEEWVRQNFVMYLIREKAFPASLMSVEKGLTVGKRVKRTDIVAYSKHGNPLLIVECKAPDIRITPEIFEQIIRYNMKLNVNHLIVTNGVLHYCCKLDYTNNSYEFLNEIPGYYSLT